MGGGSSTKPTENPTQLDQPKQEKPHEQAVKPNNTTLKSPDSIQTPKAIVTEKKVQQERVIVSNPIEPKIQESKPVVSQQQTEEQKEVKPAHNITDDDPTLSYFNKIQPQQSTKKQAVIAQIDDELDGFDIEKFRNANSGKQQPKDDMVFAQI